MPQVANLPLLGRRAFTAADHPKISQQLVDVLEPRSYMQHLAGVSIRALAD
jgi:hypothetical protein